MSLPHRRSQTQAASSAPPDPGTTDHEAVPCPRCGVIDRPLLSPGSGPHAIRASCQHCGRFLRWVSVLAPAERMARRMKNRLAAMRTLPPSAAQLAYLQALGDVQAPPATMGEASGTYGTEAAMEPGRLLA